MVDLKELMKSFRSMGCEDEALCYAACRVYVHLTEEKHLHDVRYHYAEQPQGIYLTAKNGPESAAPIELFIPVLATGELEFSNLDYYRNSLTLPNCEKPESIVLAICDSSSTVLLYRVTQGLKNIAEKLPSKGKLIRQKLQAVRKNT